MSTPSLAGSPGSASSRKRAAVSPSLRPPRVGLRVRFVGAISLLAVVIVTVVSAIEIRRDRQEILGELVRKARATASLVAVSATDDFALLDIKQLQGTLANLRRQEDVVSAYAFNPDGRILTDGTRENPRRHQVLDDPVTQQVLQTGNAVVQVGENLLEVTQAVVLGDQRLGGIRIGYSLQGVHAQVRARRERSIVLSLVFIVVALALVWQLAGAVTRPLAVMLEGVRAIAEGDLNTRLRVQTGDELQVFASAFNEMTESLQETTEKLTHDAIHDALTGLPNRTLFLDRLQHAVARAARSGTLSAVLFLDADGFKIINDSLGHGAGDRFLQDLAQRLQGALRPSDTVARLGGDEFAVLLEDLDRPGDALQLAQRIQRQLETPFTLGGQEIFTSTSIGIALSSGQSDPAALLRDADTAMYRAKTAGKGRIQIFDEVMHIDVRRLLRLQTDLRRALERQEFHLAYQPILALASGRVVGCEALLRWRHPTDGHIPPRDFIPVAEETGLIIPIGEWVLREACRQMQQWQRANPGLPPMTVSVNVARRQFAQPDFPFHVERALAQAGWPPQQLVLEVTESTVMEQADIVARALARLDALGVRLAIDDFGTGHSALSLLHRFPIHVLKIDRSFVRSLDVPARSGAILRGLIALGEDIGVDVIVEGIETDAQLATLLAMGCPFGQGYLFSPPTTLEAIGAMALRPAAATAPPSNPA